MMAPPEGGTIMKTAIAFATAALICAASALGAAGPTKPHTCTGPAEWNAQGIGGEVTLAFTITAQGTVTDIRVLDTSGYPEMDARAVECARDWEYRPAVKDGVPVATPWRTTLMMGDIPTAMASKRTREPLKRDIHDCVMATGTVNPTPDIQETTDLRVTFPLKGKPTVKLELSTANEALARAVMTCATGSPALAGAGRPGTTALLTFNWSTLIRIEKARAH
jgi:TonB family protein